MGFLSLEDCWLRRWRKSVSVCWVEEVDAHAQERRDGQDETEIDVQHHVRLDRFDVIRPRDSRGDGDQQGEEED